ncbi:MAG: hypothetical protein ACI8P9_002703 [Parasphingorhabdus sp.]|jgi:hypothetical protein
MNFSRQLLFISLFSVVSGAQAVSTPLLGSDLNSQTVYSSAAITTGASSIVGGNLQAVAGATLGAATIVGGNLVAGAAVTLGASGKVVGYVTAREAGTLGADATIGGNFTTGAAATLGAYAIVSGDLLAGAVVTLGASANVKGNMLESHLEHFSTVDQAAADNKQTQLNRAQLKQAQVALSSMRINTKLATTITENKTLQPGVYHAANLSTTAGITLTLDGNNKPNFWVFNVDTYIAFGANLTIELLNVTADSSIIWNTGGYTFIGAGSNVIGTIFTGSYVTTGEGSTLTGIGKACGGVFTSDGAVTLGANNTMGAEGCTVGAANNFIIEESGIASFFIGGITGANAGPDQSVNIGDNVTLIGSESGGTHNNGAYAWKQIGSTSLTGTLLNSAAAISPTFTAPAVDVGGKTFSFELTFIDINGTSTKDIVNITVTNVNNAPTAIAGVTQSISADSPVRLDGSSSYDPDSDELSYQWKQMGGTTKVELFNSDSAYPTFTPKNSNQLVFQLTVSDGKVSAVDHVTIMVNTGNNYPMAKAGDSQNIDENTLFEMHGGSSEDPDSDTLTYEWTQIGSTIPVIISDSTTATPSFLAPHVNVEGENLTFEVMVNDGNGGTSYDKVTFHVRHTSDIPNVSNAQPSSACLWPRDHKLLLVKITGISDTDDNATITIDSVTQDEATNGTGIGDTAIGDTGPDAVIEDGNLYLRAESSDTGDGRVYHVNFTASNANGEKAGKIDVRVPNDQGSASCDSVIDSGENYDSIL